MVFHLILCSLFFPLLVHSDILVCFLSQQHTIHVVVSCIFHNLTHLNLAVVQPSLLSIPIPV